MTMVIDSNLVRRLLQAQFPEWAALPIEAAQPQGWDNRTFRLGEALSVRLPSAVGYTPQVEKEHRWLPLLAAHLPLPIPAPIAQGQPGSDFPWPWSIYRWLEGETAVTAPLADPVTFAQDLGRFLTALQLVEADGGPSPGLQTAYRGGPLTTYDAETRSAIATLQTDIDAQRATRIWEDALDAPWQGPPVWFHGDVAVGNLLVQGGWLSGVIDFGCSGVGDPACDTVIAWTLFKGASRAAFQATLPLDAATWTRGRGWALWKALITIIVHRDDDPAKVTDARRVLSEVMA